MTNDLRATVSILLTLVLAGAGGCAGSQPSQVYETFELAFDGRPWVVVFRDVPPAESKEKDTIIQYVPEGSTIMDWSEMVTQRSFPGLEKTSTPEQEMADDRKQAMDGCSKVAWEAVAQQPGSITYVAEFTGCTESRSAHEIGRFIMSSRAIYLVTYQSKKPSLSTQDRQAWIDLLGRAHYEAMFQ